MWGPIVRPAAPVKPFSVSTPFELLNLIVGFDERLNHTLVLSDFGQLNSASLHLSKQLNSTERHTELLNSTIKYSELHSKVLPHSPCFILHTLWKLPCSLVSCWSSSNFFSSYCIYCPVITNLYSWKELPDCTSARMDVDRWECIRFHRWLLTWVFLFSLWSSAHTARDGGGVILHLMAAGVDLNNECHWTTDGWPIHSEGAPRRLVQLSEFILCCSSSSFHHWNEPIPHCIMWPRHFP